MMSFHCMNHELRGPLTLLFSTARFVLIGFLKNPASHLARSPLSHSYSYDSAADRPICLAGFPRNSDPLVQYAG
jgi:hypothetical protein